MKKEKEKQPVNEEKKQSGEVTRRDFLVGAGTVVVGGAIGAGVLSGCSGGEEVTKTVVQTTTKTVPTNRYSWWRWSSYCYRNHNSRRWINSYIN